MLKKKVWNSYWYFSYSRLIVLLNFHHLKNSGFVFLWSKKKKWWIVFLFYFLMIYFEKHYQQYFFRIFKHKKIRPPIFFFYIKFLFNTLPSFLLILLKFHWISYSLCPSSFSSPTLYFFYEWRYEWMNKWRYEWIVFIPPLRCSNCSQEKKERKVKAKYNTSWKPVVFNFTGLSGKYKNPDCVCLLHSQQSFVYVRTKVFFTVSFLGW